MTVWYFDEAEREAAKAEEAENSELGVILYIMSYPGRWEGVWRDVTEHYEKLRMVTKTLQGGGMGLS